MYDIKANSGNTSKMVEVLGRVVSVIEALGRGQ